MVSPIRTNSVLQSYMANESKPDSKTLAPTQSNTTSLERASTASSKVIFSQAAREKLELSLSINSYHQQISKKTERANGRQK
mgnify:CR=1 FL=1